MDNNIEVALIKNGFQIWTINTLYHRRGTPLFRSVSVRWFKQRMGLFFFPFQPLSLVRALDR